MNRFFISLACLTMNGTGVSAQPKLTENNIPDVVKAMTTEEKAHFVVGVQKDKEPYKGKYLEGTGGVTYPIPRLGIPSIVMMDGPVGIRLDECRTTCFPTGLLTAASWDKETARKIGEAIGEESLDMGNDVILGPGLPYIRIANVDD